MTRKRRAFGCCVLLILLLAACDLAGDVTPPPDARVPGDEEIETTTEPVGRSAPAGSPDLESGARIYAQSCAPCHGEDGRGDGPQAQELPVPPPPLADPELAATAAPGEWYAIVSEGRMESLMPPFRSLGTQQRWDVVAYALSLSVEPHLRDQGRMVFEAQCADCHLATAGSTPDGGELGDPERFAARSRADLAEIVRAGAGGRMPEFGDTLSAAEIEAVAAFTQALVWQPQQVLSAPEAEQVDGLRVTGVVRNGTDQQPVPAGLEVTLHGFDGQQEVLTSSGSIANDGSFTFGELEPTPGRYYVVSADYRGVRYASQVLQAEAGTGRLELPLTVYEVTSDPAQVRASQLHLLIDRPDAGRLQLVQVWQLVNGGDRTVQRQAGQGGVEIRLPHGAQNLRFEDPRLQRESVGTEQGFVLAAPLRPEEDELQLGFSFELPYQDGVEISQPLTMAVESARVLAVEGAPTLSGAGVVNAGPREVSGERVHIYELDGLERGETLQLQLRPAPFWSRWFTADGPSGLWFGLAALLLAIVAVYWWYRRPAIQPQQAEGSAIQAENEVEAEEELLRAIAALDDAYAGGELEPEAYQRRREALKRRLMENRGLNDD